MNGSATCWGQFDEIWLLPEIENGFRDLYVRMFSVYVSSLPLSAKEILVVLELTSIRTCFGSFSDKNFTSNIQTVLHDLWAPALHDEWVVAASCCQRRSHILLNRINTLPSICVPIHFKLAYFSIFHCWLVCNFIFIIIDRNTVQKV